MKKKALALVAMASCSVRRCSSRPALPARPRAVQVRRRAKKGGTMKHQHVGDGRRLHRSVAGVRHDLVADRVRDRAQALQLSGQAAAAGRPRCSRRLRPASRSSRRTARRTRSPSRTGFKFSNGAPVTAANFAVRDQPRAQPDDAVAGGAVHRRTIVGAQARHRRQGADGQRRRASRATSSSSS